MNKIIITVLAFSLMAGSLSAQQQWSLEQCIDHAVRNNLTIKTSELNSNAQEIRVEQAKNQILPNLSASIGQGFNFGTTLDNTSTYVQQKSNSASAGLSSNMVLFNGFRIKNNIASQQFTANALSEELKKAKESLAVNIATAFLQVLYNKEALAIAEEQVRLSEEQLRKSETMAAYGKIPEGQVNEAKAQLAKDNYASTEGKGTLQLSLLELAQMLELKETTGFDILVPSVEINPATLAIQPAEEIFDYAVGHKSDVKATEYRLKSTEKNLEISKADQYPSLSLGADYGTQYSSADYKKRPFSEQIRQQGGTSVGFRMSIPIFNRFDTKNNIRLSKIEVEKAKLEMENTKKSLYKEIQQAWLNAVKASANYSSAGEAVTNSEEAFRFATEKYNNGKATVYEFNQAKMNLASAKSSQLKAKYNLLFCIKILDFYKGEPLKL